MLNLKRVLAVLAILILIAFGFVWYSGKEVNLKLARPVPAIGNDSIISVQAVGSKGIQSFSASVEQNGQTQTVYQDETRSNQASRVYTFSAGKKQASFLKEGPAKLILKAASNDFRGRTTTLSQDIQVVLRPPSIVADGRQHYLNQGGSELVTMDVGGSWTEAGVRSLLAISLSLGYLARHDPGRFRSEYRRNRSDDYVLGQSVPEEISGKQHRAERQTTAKGGQRTRS